MPKIHPKLCSRPKPNPGLKRPMLEHPVLGAMEYINRDGGWWQGTTSIARSPVRLDLQRGANVPAKALNAAAGMLQWVQQHESEIRSFAERELKAGAARSNLVQHVKGIPKLKDTDSLVKLLVPDMVVLWDAAAELRFACDNLPGGNLLGAHYVEVRVEAQKPESVFIREVGIDNMAQKILASPVPCDAGDWENSISDQFVARAAQWGWFEFDAELRKLLAEAIDRTDAVQAKSPECALYMQSVNRVLHRIAQEAETS
jgi:hypothetical protein